MLDVTLSYHHPWRFYVASSTTKNSNNTKNLVVVVNVIPKCLKFFETLGPCLFISLRITTKDILLVFIYIFQIQEETWEWKLVIWTGLVQCSHLRAINVDTHDISYPFKNGVKNDINCVINIKIIAQLKGG